jgi:UDP-N-acetylmuramoyl-L-alanyl-D-glutamate--2,6-diaminopimelate ligase
MKLSELIRRIGDAGTGGCAVGTVRLAGDPEVTRVCEDSRKVQAGDLFMARSGTKTSGAKFAADAVAKGAVAIVSDEPIETLENVAFVQVDNGNRAMALIANELAGRPTDSMTLLAVTGTKGKTTVAYLLRAVLKAARKKCGMIGTVEIDDGKTVVPADMTTPSAVELADMFARMKANGVTHCVMEVSSHALHQDRTAGLDMAVAIFTNLTGDHLDYHKTMDEYAAAKALLFEGLKKDAVAVVNGDDSWCHRITQACKAKVIEYRYGGNKSENCLLVDIQEMTSAGMRLGVWGVDGCDYKLSTPLVGKHNAYNIAGVLAAAEGIGLDVKDVLKGLKGNTGAPGRLQPVVPAGMKRDDLPFQVFVDYAHTHDAIQNVLTALRATMKQGAREGRKEGRLICVFGCGGDRDRTKRPKMAKIAQDLADFVIVTSDNPRTENPGAIIDEVCGGFAGDWKNDRRIRVEPDRRAAIRSAIGIAGRNDVVLIAGKGHENYQILGTTKHHFDDVEEAAAALLARPLAEKLSA